MTSDGISDADWERVHAVALEIVNAELQEDSILSAIRTEKLREVVEGLRAKYGDLPSLLGTLADFTENSLQAYELYSRAIGQAQKMGGQKNLRMLIDSLLELDCLDREQRSFWERQHSNIHRSER